MAQQFSTVHPTHKKRKLVQEENISQLQSIDVGSIQLSHLSTPISSQGQSLTKLNSLYYPTSTDISTELTRIELLQTTFENECQDEQGLASVEISILDQYISLLLKDSLFFHLSQSNAVIFEDYKWNQG